MNARKKPPKRAFVTLDSTAASCTKCGRSCDSCGHPINAPWDSHKPPCSRCLTRISWTSNSRRCASCGTTSHFAWGPIFCATCLSWNPWHNIALPERLENNQGVGIFLSRISFHPYHDHPSENPEPWFLDEPPEEPSDDTTTTLDSP